MDFEKFSPRNDLAVRHLKGGITGYASVEKGGREIISTLARISEGFLKLQDAVKVQPSWAISHSEAQEIRRDKKLARKLGVNSHITWLDTPTYTDTYRPYLTPATSAWHRHDKMASGSPLSKRRRVASQSSPKGELSRRTHLHFNRSKLRIIQKRKKKKMISLQIPLIASVKRFDKEFGIKLELVHMTHAGDAM